MLLEHRVVAAGAVVGLPDERWGKTIACFIRPVEAESLDVRELHRHCRANLSPQKTPTIWCKVEAFPLTGSRKIQKFKLRDGYLAGDYPSLPSGR